MRAGRALPIAFLVGLALAAGAGLARVQAAAPRIVFDAEAQVFPEVENGTKVPAEFVVRNAGTADLVLADVRATCDCTRARAEPSVLPPGRSGKILVTLDTSYRPGDLDKEVVVASNDPARPTVVLHLRGRVFQPLTFKPAPLFLDGLAPGREAVTDVTLTNTGKRPATIRDIRAPEWDVTIALTGKGDAKVTLPVTLVPGDYLWVRVALVPGKSEKGSLVRQVVVTADPAPLVPVVLKILGSVR